MTEQKLRHGYFRAEKTTKNRDDYKVLLVGLMLSVFLLMGNFMFTALIEQRWFRDVTGQTPFHSVALLRSVVNPIENSITVSGTMIKRRCQFQSLTGYITDHEGIRHRVVVNTEPEEILTGISGNRPPSNEAETWGPWLLSFAVEVVVEQQLTPISWEIWVHHECPTRPNKQSNIFAWGDWITLINTGNDVEYLHPSKIKEIN